MSDFLYKRPKDQPKIHQIFRFFLQIVKILPSEIEYLDRSIDMARFILPRTK